jgi:hypothetical protein
MPDRRDRTGSIEDIHCPSCNHPTAHTIVASYTTYWDHEEAICGRSTRDFLRCNGCSAGTYRIISWNSEEPGCTTTHYPPRGGHIRTPVSWHHVPWDGPLRKVYEQTINAFNYDLLTLTGAGVRLLIEGICIDQNVIDGPILDAAGHQVINKKTNQPARTDRLEGKINGLAEKQLTSPQQRQHLHEIRFLGNDAAHHLDIPDVEIVNHAIDIVEHILDQVYEQPEKAKELAARKRPKK